MYRKPPFIFEPKILFKRTLQTLPCPSFVGKYLLLEMLPIARLHKTYPGTHKTKFTCI